MPNTKKQKEKNMNTRVIISTIAVLAVCSAAMAGEITLSAEQITFGSQHHFFGYIGQSKTIPWNEGDRYIVAMRAGFHELAPALHDLHWPLAAA